MKTRKIISLLLLSICLIACDSQTSSVEENKEYISMNETFYNPLAINKGLGDPDMFLHDGYYYFTFSQGSKIAITKSKRMTQVTASNDNEEITKIIFRPKSINVVQIWAPEIFFFNGLWYVYFTASIDSADSMEIDTNRRTYVLKSKTDDAFGEWETAIKLDLPCDYRSIDATFMDYNNHQYIIWAGWPEASNTHYKQNLYITELETNDPTRAKSLDPSARHLISTPTNAWETSSTIQNEGAFAVITPNGKPLIFFSGNYSGDDSYCIAYLEFVGNDVTSIDSWRKTDEPFMKTDMAHSEVIAPGHCSVTYSIDKTEYWMCYHAAKLSGSGWDRMARLQKLEWRNDLPYIENIYKSTDEVPLPSGEVVNRMKFEAEKAILSEDCFILDKSGYASNDQAVSISDHGSILFEVDVPANGQYCIGVRFANRDSNEVKMKVTVNGDEYEVFAPNTQYDDSFIMSWFYSDLYIKRSGKNQISITCDASIYIDCLIIDCLDF